MLPDSAYLWRPFAAPNLIRRLIRAGDGTLAHFTVDPGTQRWLLLDPAAARFLERADGRTRLADIAGSLRALDPACYPAARVVALARELREGGLLFDSEAERRAATTPVYNASEQTGLHIEITNACNMTCTHCYVSSGKQLPGEMTMEEIYRTIDMLPSFSGRQIAISGGEPIVRKGCMELVEYCAITCGHNVDLYSNGRKFPRKFAERIVAINERRLGHVRIQVSLEGAVAPTNDLVRGPGSFDDAMATLTMFRELGLGRDTVLFVCLTRANMGELDEIVALAERLDVGMLVFSQWQRQGNAKDVPWTSIAPSVAEWVAAGEKLFRYRNPRLAVHGNFYGDVRNTDAGRLCLDSPLFPKQVYFYNAFPRVTPQGDILADQLWVDESWVLGNIRAGDSLQTAFRSAKFYGQLEAMSRRAESIPECRKCVWRDVCEGGSAGHTYAEYGHLNARDLFCESRMYWFERYVTHQAEQALGQPVVIVDGPAPDALAAE
jgi:radical SAM protein with 4Fe4S-binding SPASM domain